MKFAHLNIVSKDWKKSADFYCNVFGCTPVPPIRDQSGKWLERGTKVKNAQLEGIHLRLPGSVTNGPTLEIYQYSKILERDTSAANLRGFGHIAFEVENVVQTLDSLLKNGGEKHGEIVTKDVEGIGKLTFTYAKDPDGNLIELQSWNK